MKVSSQALLLCPGSSGVGLEVAGPATEGTQATATRGSAVTIGVLR